MLSIQIWYDEVAEFRPSLFKAKAERNVGGNSLAKRIEATAEELQPTYGDLGGNMGESAFPELFGHAKNDQQSQWRRMALDLAMPGLVGSATNPRSSAYYLRRQAIAAWRSRRLSRNITSFP
jgi:hypothetical protein